MLQRIKYLKNKSLIDSVLVLFLIIIYIILNTFVFILGLIFDDDQDVYHKGKTNVLTDQNPERFGSLGYYASNLDD